jgi:hypothetical protein
MNILFSMSLFTVRCVRVSLPGPTLQLSHLKLQYIFRTFIPTHTLKSKEK